MYLADYHVHTACSPDGHLSMTRMAEEGVRRGLNEICFTDHVETVEWGTVAPRKAPYDWTALQEAYAAARRQLDGRITLKLGIELGEAYLEEVLKLARWGRFSVLGHLTLPVRCINEMRHKNISFRPHMAQVEEILRTIIPRGVGIECNTNRGNAPLPDGDVLKLYRQLGGEIITLGSDAHTAEHLGCAIGARQELLRSCGFRYFTTFDRMKPTFQAL